MQAFVPSGDAVVVPADRSEEDVALGRLRAGASKARGRSRVAKQKNIRTD